MPDVFSLHAASLGSVMDYLGTACPTVTWNGKQYRTLSSTGTNSQDLTYGGFDSNTDRTCVIIGSDFSDGLTPPSVTLPALGQQMTYDATGQIYRINEIRRAPGDRQIHFGLVSLTKGVSGK